MSPDEDAENNAPRLDKGKGRATDLDVLLAADSVLDLDPSSKTIADGMGLSPAEVQLNIDAFPKADSKDEAPLLSECSFNCLLNGPSSGHTLACQRARGVLTTPLVVPKYVYVAGAVLSTGLTGFCQVILSLGFRIFRQSVPRRGVVCAR